MRLNIMVVGFFLAVVISMAGCGSDGGDGVVSNQKTTTKVVYYTVGNFTNSR